MKFVAVATKNGQTSGLKDTRKEAEDWARGIFDQSKTTEVYILQAVAVFKVAPREIIETPLLFCMETTTSRGRDRGEPIGPLSGHEGYADGTI